MVAVAAGGRSGAARARFGAAARAPVNGVLGRCCLVCCVSSAVRRPCVCGRGVRRSCVRGRGCVGCRLGSMRRRMSCGSMARSVMGLCHMGVGCFGVMFRAWSVQRRRDPGSHDESDCNQCTSPSAGTIHPAGFLSPMECRSVRLLSGGVLPAIPSYDLWNGSPH
jgi:hypothetical protein